MYAHASQMRTGKVSQMLAITVVAFPPNNEGIDMTDYEIIIKVDGKELHHSVLNDLTYQSISEDIAEYFEKIEKECSVE